jgi:ferritin-like metal-binding protein YciE
LKCKVVYALFDEVEDLIEGAAHVPVCDAGLVTVAQRIEHYEIAAYGALVQLARALSLGEDAQLLDQSLLEEERATQHLAVIAKRIYLTALVANLASEQRQLHAKNESKRVSR